VDEAIDCFHKALENQPDHVKARHALGLTLLRNGQVNEAIDCFHKVLEIQPGDVAVQNDLAWVLATFPQASIRNGSQAVNLAEQAERLSGSTNPAILGTLAAAYAEVGHFPQAVAAAQRALQQAGAQNDSTRVSSLKAQLECYQSGSPFRDASLTNRP
jgi:tetratricopeptide (TPR) repeat protein